MLSYLWQSCNSKVNSCQFMWAEPLLLLRPTANPRTETIKQDGVASCGRRRVQPSVARTVGSCKQLWGSAPTHSDPRKGSGQLLLGFFENRSRHFVQLRHACSLAAGWSVDLHRREHRCTRGQTVDQNVCGLRRVERDPCRAEQSPQQFSDSEIVNSNLNLCIFS